MKYKEQFTIDFNPRTGGVYCFFEHDGNEFYADLCDVFFLGETECMIFHSKDEQVTDLGDLYCKRGIPVTKKALEECIREFIKNYDGGGE